MKSLSIGGLSARTSVNIETIRYYERKGILPVASRSASGRRIYSEDDVRRLNFVHKCRSLGFPLKDISSLLELVDHSGFTCGQIHQLTLRHADAVTRKIRDLTRMEQVLLAMAAQCDKGNVPDCPIIDSLYDVQ